MAIVKALKAFFKKLTGEDVNGSSIADLIMNGTAEVNSQGGDPDPGYTVTKIEFEARASGLTANMTVAEALAAMTTGPVFATCLAAYGEAPYTFGLGLAIAESYGTGIAFVDVRREPGGEGHDDVFSIVPIFIGNLTDGWLIV